MLEGRLERGLGVAGAEGVAAEALAAARVVLPGLEAPVFHGGVVGGRRPGALARHDDVGDAVDQPQRRRGVAPPRRADDVVAHALLLATLHQRRRALRLHNTMKNKKQKQNQKPTQCRQHSLHSNQRRSIEFHFRKCETVNRVFAEGQRISLATMEHFLFQTKKTRFVFVYFFFQVCVLKSVAL